MKQMTLSAAETLKFEVLAAGIKIDERAREYIGRANGDRPLTPADYASTSGVILRLDGDVWVNAPIPEHNPNFVDETRFTLTERDGRLTLEGRGLSASASFWLPPRYHDEVNEHGVAHATYAFTHSDRVRISPIAGCAYTCKFCDLPYEFRYRRKDVEGLVAAIAAARDDPVQPAHHILISGGTPRPDDFDYLRQVYETVITTFQDLPVDIMMVPIPEIVDVPWLADLGVNELSINLEIFNETIARDVMPRKFRAGRDELLRFAGAAAEILGPGRVRSMLMVGLEPLEDTLAGVRALIDIGCVPVLSPFRPDPLTPLRDVPPPTADDMRETYQLAFEICRAAGSPLGPSCRPCAHNTLTLSSTSSNGDASMSFGEPNVV
jgi:hypothetical protein